MYKRDIPTELRSIRITPPEKCMGGEILRTLQVDRAFAEALFETPEAALSIIAAYVCRGIEQNCRAFFNTKATEDLFVVTFLLTRLEGDNGTSPQPDPVERASKSLDWAILRHFRLLVRLQEEDLL